MCGRHNFINKQFYNVACTVYEKLIEQENEYEGLTPSLADSYSTNIAVTTNTYNKKVKLVMEDGQFNDLDQVIEKFVSSSTETKTHSVLFMTNRNTNNYFQ